MQSEDTPQAHPSEAPEPSGPDKYELMAREWVLGLAEVDEINFVPSLGDLVRNAVAQAIEECAETVSCSDRCGECIQCETADDVRALNPKGS